MYYLYITLRLLISLFAAAISTHVTSKICCAQGLSVVHCRRMVLCQRVVLHQSRCELHVQAPGCW